MEAGALSEAEQREFQAWRDAAPHHHGALIRARAAWANLDRLGALAGPTPADPVPVAETSRSLEGHNSGRAEHRFLSPQFWKIAASVAVLAIACGTFFALTFDRYVYESGIGEVRRVTLTDGSSMMLNTATRASVRFDAATREVRLDRGEALFQVHKDPARPFIVRIGDSTVRAIGTAFAVRIDGTAVDVTVTEGVVEVAHSRAPPVRIVANQHAVVQPPQIAAIEPIEPAVVARELAWRDGVVAFNGESLGKAVAEVNRHSLRQIVIADPALNSKPIVGLFRVGDVEGFAQATATALGAQVQMEKDEILLTSSAPP
jgi:transmembrane sensor